MDHQHHSSNPLILILGAALSWLTHNFVSYMQHEGPHIVTSCIVTLLGAVIAYSANKLLKKIWP